MVQVRSGVYRSGISLHQLGIGHLLVWKQAARVLAAIQGLLHSVGDCQGQGREGRLVQDQARQAQRRLRVMLSTIRGSLSFLSSLFRMISRAHADSYRLYDNMRYLQVSVR